MALHSPTTFIPRVKLLPRTIKQLQHVRVAHTVKSRRGAHKMMLMLIRWLRRTQRNKQKSQHDVVVVWLNAQEGAFATHTKTPVGRDAALPPTVSGSDFIFTWNKLRSSLNNLSVENISWCGKNLAPERHIKTNSGHEFSSRANNLPFVTLKKKSNNDLHDRVASKTPQCLGRER